MKPIIITFSVEAEEVYNCLVEASKKSKVEKSLFNSINSKIELIKSNHHYGNPISKALIPHDYVSKGITNLFRVELSQFWRMLYTLRNDNKEIFIIAIVLDILDHNDYNKKFGYKKN